MATKAKKVSELPEASTIDGFFAFGTDKDNKSIKAPMSLFVGAKGDKGDSPVIGANGNWWVSGIDTGKPARGEDGTNLSYKAMFNVSQYNNKYDYADAATARNAVPSALRTLEQMVAYKLVSGKSVVEQYTGTAVSGWATAANWKLIGEVSKEDLSLKADKVLTDSSPATYFKSGEGGSSEIDLTTEVRASIVPFVWNLEKSWITSNRQANGANLALQPSTLEGQGEKRSMIKYKLKPNTWYRLGGLFSPLSNYCYLPPLDSNNLAATGQPNQMLPVATLTRDGVAAQGMRANTAEWMYQKYGEPIIFKTRVQDANVALWLTVMVKLDDTVVMNKSASVLDYFKYPDWAFDSRDTVTLHELPDYDGSENSNTEPVDKLIDSLGNLLKEFNFDTIVSNRLNEIKGIIAGGTSTSNPDLLPENPTIIPNFQLKYDGVALNVGSSQWGYLDDYIPVEPNSTYTGLRGLQTLWTEPAAVDLRYWIFYDKDKKVLPDPDQTLKYAGSNTFITPDNCYFVRPNISNYLWNNPPANSFKHITRAFPAIITEESRVSLSSADLEDAKEITSGGVSGITIPTLLIPKANIIEDGGSDDGFTINMRNLSTFVGSFNTAIDKIFAVQPKARHVFVGHFSYDGLNGNGWLRPMIETQRAMCKNRNIPYIDLASIMGFTFNDGNVVNVDGVDIDYNNLKSFTPDYTHPGRDASQVMANLLADRLTELLKPYVKNGEIVANIGDSVSAGYTGLPSGDTAWARYIERALFAIGCTVKRYASSGGALRATTIDQGIVNNGFMGNTDPGWNFQNHVLDKIGTSEQPNVYLWELGHNDFTADYRDFKLNW